MNRDKYGKFATKRVEWKTIKKSLPVCYMIAVVIAITINHMQDANTLYYTKAFAQEVEAPKEVVLGSKESKYVINYDWSEDRLRQEVENAAVKYNTSAEKMWNTIMCENPHLDADLQSLIPANGPNGRENSWGLAQIHLDYHPDVSKEEATNPYFALDFMAKHFAEGNARLWTCYRNIYGT